MATILLTILGGAIGLLVGLYWVRLFPKYPKGTYVYVTYGDQPGFLCQYLHRASKDYHHLRVVDGDYLGWDGRKITAGVDDMSPAGGWSPTR